MIFLCFTMTFHRLGRGPLCGPTIYLDLELHHSFCLSKTGLCLPQHPLYSRSPTDHSKRFLHYSFSLCNMWRLLCHYLLLHSTSVGASEVAFLGYFNTYIFYISCHKYTSLKIHKSRQQCYRNGLSNCVARSVLQKPLASWHA